MATNASSVSDHTASPIARRGQSSTKCLLGVHKALHRSVTGLGVGQGQVWPAPSLGVMGWREKLSPCQARPLSPHTNGC